MPVEVENAGLVPSHDAVQVVMIGPGDGGQASRFDEEVVVVGGREQGPGVGQFTESVERRATF